MQRYIYNNTQGFLSMTIKTPPKLRPGRVFSRDMVKAMSDELNIIGNQALRDAGDITVYSQIKENYGFEITASPLYTRLSLYNTNPIFNFINQNSIPHIPPFGKNSRLYRWAKRHGTSAFMTAMVIAQRGTFGKFYLQKIYDKYLPIVGRRLRDVINQLLDMS